MRKKPRLRLRIVFLSLLFIGAPFVCSENKMALRAEPVQETLNDEAGVSWIEDGEFRIAQTTDQNPAGSDPKGGTQVQPGRRQRRDDHSPRQMQPRRPQQQSAPSVTTPAPAAPPAPVSSDPTPPTAAPQTPSAAPSGAPPTPPPPPPAVQRIQESPRGSGFIFNFDNADLYEVIRVIGEVMKLNYIIDPRVKGVVNIHTSGQVNTNDVFPVFQSILQLNGAIAIKKGQIYEIVPFGDAKKMYTPLSKIEDSEKSLSDEKYVIQIVPLNYIPVPEVSKMVKPFLSDGADLVEHPSQNILIVGDVASNIRKVLDLIALFDIDLFTDLRVRIYPISHSDVNEIAKEMERLFTSFEVSTKSGRGVGITFTPVTRINALLVVSSIPNIFEKVEGWLKQLDRTPADEAKMGVFVYYVQNGKAKDMAEVLKQIFTPPKEKKPTTTTTTTTTTTPATPTSPASGQPRSVRPTPAPPATGAAPPPSGEEGGVPTGEITIVVDETTNALIIRALPREYRFVLETIKKLDLYPKQVLIEVFLAEITLDDTTKYGLEFSKFTDSFTKGGKLYTWSLGMGGTGTPADFTTGMRYAIEATDKLTAAVHASATDNRLKIISSPHLMASNNKEAKIQIGTSQPILTNTYTTTGIGTTTGVVEGTIEYKDVGIIITVTPRISDGGLVTMDIAIENSSVDTTKLGSLDNVPVFKKKTAKTTLSISEAQTIVIGGLIEESGRVNKSGVPLLSKIPLLGSLFGYHDYGKTKTELMLLLTPHVISDTYQSNAVTREFKERVDTIRRELERKTK
jgi:general secretion pathway protein D